MASFSQPAEHCGALSKPLPATGSHSNGGGEVLRLDEYIGLRHYLQHMHSLHAFFIVQKIDVPAFVCTWSVPLASNKMRRQQFFLPVDFVVISASC